MQNTLTNLCIQNIADQIYRSPPMIQEMIIGESTDIIQEKVKSEVNEELINEIKVLKTIVPSIAKYIIINRVSFFNEDIDYYKMHKDIPRYIVKLAIDIAENTISQLNNSFNLLTFVASRRHNFSSSASENSEEYETENSSDYE